MIIALKTILLLALGAIAYQDIKDRWVWWFLYPITAYVGGVLYSLESFMDVYLYAILINLSMLGLVFLFVYGYARLIAKKPFKEMIGLGDLMLFMALAVSFPPWSFLVIVFFSSIFAMAVHELIKKKQTTIPAAGYISLFLIGVYLINWSGLYNNLYLL